MRRQTGTRSGAPGLSRGPAQGTQARPSSASKLALLEALLDRREEAGGVGAVDDAVVVGQRQVDHRADRDDLAELRVVDDDRALDDGAGAEDRRPAAG